MIYEISLVFFEFSSVLFLDCFFGGGGVFECTSSLITL